MGMIRTLKRMLSSVRGVALPFLLVLAACSSGPKRTLNDKERARFYVDLGYGALVEKDVTGALQYLLAAEELDATSAELHHGKALAYYARKDFATAISSARRAVRINPKYSDAHNTLGKFLMDQGQSEEAIPHLEQAAQDPVNREAYKALTNLGILYYRRGDAEAARKNLAKADVLGAGQACVAHYYLGHLSLKENRFREAIESYTSATRQFCASFADAHLALGIAYEKARDFKLARKKFVEISSRFANTPVANQALDHLKYLP